MKVRDLVGPCEDKTCFFCRFLWKFYFPFQGFMLLVVLVAWLFHL